MRNHGRTPIPVRRSDSIRQRTKQNGVGSHIDAVSLEILALTSITERGYWGIELGGHTHLLDTSSVRELRLRIGHGRTCERRSYAVGSLNGRIVRLTGPQSEPA